MNKNKKTREMFLKANRETIIVCHEFENEYGEKYVVYNVDFPSLKNVFFITGDELDWELGWETDGKNVWQRFKLSEDEIKKLNKVNLFKK